MLLVTLVFTEVLCTLALKSPAFWLSVREQKVIVVIKGYN